MPTTKTKRISTPGLLETMTVSDVRAFQPEVIVLPLGSTEPHGPHLPYGTDTFLGDAVTAEAVLQANREDARILRLPPLPYGNNVNFKELPFACRLRVETLLAVIGDLVAFSLEEGVRKFVLVNAHGGNDGAVKAGLRQLVDRHGEEAFVCACGPCHFNGGLYASFFQDHSPHAGDYETSLIMHIAPGLVVESARKPEPLRQPTVPALRPGGGVDWVRQWHRLMPESYAGTPDTASAEKGKECFDRSVLGLARFLVDLSREPWRPGFPFPEEEE